jgi:hypothetical protein
MDNEVVLYVPSIVPCDVLNTMSVAKAKTTDADGDTRIRDIYGRSSGSQLALQVN